RVSRELHHQPRHDPRQGRDGDRQRQPVHGLLARRARLRGRRQDGLRQLRRARRACRDRRLGDPRRAHRRAPAHQDRGARLPRRLHAQPRAMSAAVRAAPSGVQRLRVGFVAGEHSGDQLGAALIAALRERVPGLECFGIAGPKMIAAGCEAWWGAEQLSVMGLAEVLRHLPRLLRLRAAVARRFREARPDVFVGIDAPEFNLSLARGLKRAGVRTVQYVSPQVWAWRQGRVRSIARSCDLVLCLLPFEAKFYAQHGVRAAFVGHPLADQIPLEVDREAARRALGVEAAAPLEALLSARPMVVAYRVSPLTAFALRTLALVKVRYFSQPNLLAGRRLVPEFFQEQVRGAALGDALLQELEDRGHVRELVEEFAAVHRTLRRGGAALAAQAILECAARASALGGPPAMSAGGADGGS